ncbi:pectinacetylesterase family protein [Oceanospirillaceae bacterium]|nr:pectinacetylesterase family protein [Oceanospirillaceae bacterium]
MNTGLRYLILLCTSLVATQVIATDMSGWSDKTVCRLVKSGGLQEHIDEAAARGMSCETPVVVKKPSSAVTESPTTIATPKTPLRPLHDLLDQRYIENHMIAFDLGHSAQAVCNTGSAATFLAYIDADNTKWAILLQGGGAVGSDQDYINRESNLKNSMLVDRKQRSGPIDENNILGSLNRRNYNIVVLPYCSSDAHGGNHMRRIKGERVAFKGRKIVEALVEQLSPYIKPSDELLVGGFSAGGAGTGYNIDLFSTIESQRTRYVFDSNWVTQDEVDYTSGGRGEWKDYLKYMIETPPNGGCKAGNPEPCSATLARLQEYGSDGAFIAYNSSEWRSVKSSSKFEVTIKREIKAAGGGISVSEKYGTNDWSDVGAHVILFAGDAYNKTTLGLTPRVVFEAWLDDKKGGTYIDL